MSGPWMDLTELGRKIEWLEEASERLRQAHQKLFFDYRDLADEVQDLMERVWANLKALEAKREYQGRDTT